MRTKKNQTQLEWAKTVNKFLIDLGDRVETLEAHTRAIQGMLSWHIAYKDGKKLRTVTWEHKGKKK